ncbi:glycosyltransferase family 4 protein [Xanthomarina spongicola]|uniref:GalNAc-alpha-(1->4)-GalNAc-alpha-(1->3)-diNAcBac-PP-undecaprenol alpha-1,4-N-acetyl-D-galactosaminyltransferase n=1 Tax=Xanthomarina spongicola TaxID=570520 RepID=A0A316DP19_9FLAO|nr:glycosyltransferase family 4 protein [Xanthomarina spongicola]PWK19957.1 GalNAc-alpha-(1->4)-GalNAc-alpha-(1->3)-diNAcBac-PP-undecaprenol alpha-1,4-N-acetyl-D-galactosaminyltransferase [Xanthomarina spongicola]
MKKSIAFVLPNLNAGGAQRVVSSLANSLIKEYDVCIIVLYNCDPFYKLHPDISIRFCLPEYNSNPNTFQSIINIFKLVNSLIKILKNNNTSIAIGFMPVTNIYTILATRFINIPNIISERANPKYSSMNKFWTYFRKIAYPFANCLVVQTKANKDFFKTYVRTEIEVINNPVDRELLEKRNFQFPKENIILNVGRLDEPKNQDLLICAFSNINNSKWKLILVGDGNNYNEYKNLIASLKMQDKIILAGNITDVSKYYNMSKIFAFTSKCEGFPNALIEAMSFGLACISTDCPHGPSEIINNNHNGILIPVGDQKALEENLVKLMNDEVLQEEFRLKAVQSTLAYQPNDIASEWSKIINNLILKEIFES